MDSFTLHKSYLDVVDESGRCAIVYRSELKWGPLALRWEALSFNAPGGESVHRGAFGGSGLGLRVSCQAWSVPFSARLLDTPSGTLDWACDAPGADVVVQSEEGTVRGAGYSEHLVLAMLPWRLPIDELRWGRWASAGSRRSLVWIEWRGAHPLTLVLDNGVARGDAAVGDEAIRCDGVTLRLAGTRTLYARTLAEALDCGSAGALPHAGELVRRCLPSAWGALEDRKSLSTGVMGNESGWAVHEIVRFP